jgi:uncharacterized cupin superfamily protein
MNGDLPILNIDETPLDEWRHGERYEARMAQIGKRLGAKKLGYRIVVLPPGKVAWPLHAHLVNEEMFFIVEGTGRLRLGGRDWPVKAGDVIAVPPGSDTPHQIVNDSDADLKYLCVSTMEEPDIVMMPDSGKVNIMAGSPPGGDKAARTLSICLPLEAAVDYWEGEG